MLNRFRTVKETLQNFCRTQYRTNFYNNVALSLFVLFFYLTTIFMMSDWFQHSFWKTLWIVAATLIVLLFGVFYWIHFYRTIIVMTLKIENIKEKYTLIDADQMVSFEKSLNIILDLIDTSLEKEYSNRLLQKQAELDAMQSQINPHFLYNTLDTIRGYAMMENAPITSDMVEILSRLFRYMISQKNPQVTLSQELSILNDYIKIQEYRNNQHIIFRQQIEPNLPIVNYKIPKLIIQPFVENAIKHGMNGITKDFVITLSMHSTQSRLIITVADNGVGMAPEQLRLLNQKFANNESDSLHTVKDKSKGTGIALTNVNSRIKLLYGDEYGVVAYSTPGKGSEFQLTLPYYFKQE